MSRTKTRQGQAAARAGAARQAPSPRDPRRLVAHGLSALRRRHLAYAGAALGGVVAVAVAFAVFGGGDDRPPIPDTRDSYTPVTGEQTVTTAGTARRRRALSLVRRGQEGHAGAARGLTGPRPPAPGAPTVSDL
ncbi:hypothetical protein P8A21_15345 [Streptomyces poriferorum]|uniref:hypothetical protein n=1 Tax=Streptomyces poriferorum TaxID=2798799 RepID=UPI00273F104F|nr:hypothetical protein [Streptomyces sp. Alt1]WLQ48784.1 hypothetical protein P8A21_15345 [Streptomyces sp. Alt1]